MNLLAGLKRRNVFRTTANDTAYPVLPTTEKANA
jgi:hypothetical protein